MTTTFKKNALVMAMILAGALLFAKPAVSDYQGKDSGKKFPAWVELMDKAAGSNKVGSLEYSKATKKLYKKLGVTKDKVLYYSIKGGSDKDALLDSAKAEAQNFATKEILDSAQKILDKSIGEGKGKLSQQSSAIGLARAEYFWLEGEGKAFKAYSILQITSLNKEEAAKNLAYTFMRKNGYIKASEETSSER